MADRSHASKGAGWRALLPCRRNKGRSLELPVEHVGLLSYLSYAWLDGFMWRAFRWGINEQNLWKCPTVDGAQHNADRLSQMWEEEVKKKGRKKAQLSTVFMRFIKTRLLISILVLILSLTFLLLSVAYFLLEVMRYSYLRKDALWLGLVYVFGFLVMDVLQNVFFLCVFSITHIAGARLRSAALLLLYRKLLTISHLRDKTTGYIVNLFANDSQRIFDGVSYAPMLLVAPILGLATTGYSIYLLGVWPLVGFAVLLFLFPVQMCIGKLIMTFRSRAMLITDQRARCMLEMLASIRFIKMYSWEKPLTDKVLDIRNKEKALIEKVNMSTSMMFSVSTIVVSMATVATLMAHTLSGHDLTAVEAFIYLAVYSSIQGKLMLSTMAVKSFSELKVAANRFQEILLFADHKSSVTLGENPDFAVEVRTASIMWPGSDSPDTVKVKEKENGASVHNGRIYKKTDEKETEMEQLNLQEDDYSSTRMLTDISFRVRRGEILGVTGPIGSGKSALITGLLGQMQITEGEVYVRGNVAYVPQQAWIYNSSLRENILFGQLYEKSKYDRVVQLCCLEMDFSILPSGDTTEVGERGVTLSGGQKQRISLARAIYSDRDVYLLDDPFSAVDPDIADTLYQNLIQNALVGKTVIFATHTAKYLPNCDVVLFLRDGSIVQQGSHDELREAGGEYYDYYQVAKSHDGQTRELKTKMEDIFDEDGREINENKSTLLSRKSTKVKSKAIKDEAEKLVRKEEQEAGAVTVSTYKVYSLAAGGVISLLVAGVLFILAEGSRVFSYWWLAHWLSQGSGNITSAPQLIVPALQTYSNSSQDGYKLDNSPPTMKPGVGGGSIADNPKLSFYNLVYGLSLLLTLILFIFRAVIFTKFTMRAANILHHRLLHKVMRCTMMFFDTTPLGRVMNRFSRDMDEVDSHLPPMVEQTLQSIISIILYVVMISVIINWFPVAVPPLLVVFLFLYAVFRVGLRDLKRLQNVSVSPLLSHISATIQGSCSLHAYDKINDFSHRFVELLDYNSVTLILFNFCMRWINLRLSFITTVVGFLTALLVVLLPDVIAPAYAGLAIVYATQLAGLFQFFIRSAAEAEARFTSVERIDSYIQNLESEADLIVPTYRPMGEWPTEGHIRFDKLEMRYRPGLPLVLKDVSFDIKPRETIGIVGRTGSGKTSLAMSLFRLVEASGGKIEIDGMDIGWMGIEDLRTKLSAIPQDPVLFSGTIRSNLDPSLRSIDEEMWRALDKCHIKDMVLTLEGQLDAIVSEGGDNFSAGEKQLLCMARVLLRHSRVLVLDEATAAMDSETDSLIQKSLKESFADCTLLIIAHRLSTVLNSDRVLVMNKGEVVEFDTPDALMAKPDSLFNQLMAVANDTDNQEDVNDMLSSDAWV